MCSQPFMVNVNRAVAQNVNECNETKPVKTKEKVMSYEEKSVGSTAFFKCEACPFMALAEDDIKFHLFTVHPDLAKTNGLADNIQIPCPGCTSVFDAEETLRTHLRNHHKMGIKDVKKMVKSLVQIALKNANLKKETNTTERNLETPVARQITDLKMPQVIEIVPDVITTNNDLPKGVAFISVDELHKMSTPNFEKIDPKEIIQEASINIVYTNEVSTQYVSVSEATNSNQTCNIIQVPSVTPDLISSIHPKTSTNDSVKQSPQKDLDPSLISTTHGCKRDDITPQTKSGVDTEKKVGVLCSVGGCHIRLKEEKNLLYHRKCHQNGKLICPECSKVCPAADALHTHLWKIHAVDLELPTCEICGFKTYKKYRLLNIHMKCHGKIKAYFCSICSRSFKNASQLSKHKLIHKKDSTPVQCHICQREFNNERRLTVHVTEVHDKLKPFRCCHCDYTAARKEELKLHLRSHTGDKPYACDQCSYRSADHNAMRRHKKVHSKEGVYKCKYCPYTAIQSTVFASHMISKHPNVNSNDLHRCPYCPFKSVSKDKYVVHLTNHADKEGIQLLIEMTKGKTNKLSWTIPSDTDKTTEVKVTNENGMDVTKTVNEIPIEVYDCDSISESLPQSYPKNYCTSGSSDVPQPSYDTQDLVADFNKDDNNSDCLISESSNETLMERHQYQPQLPLQLAYDGDQSNLHGFLNTAVSMEQSLLQNESVNSLASNTLVNSISSNIMSNFPIRLPPVPPNSLSCNNIMLKPVDKLTIPATKVTGPIIKPTQILPVPSSSNSPINICVEDGAPRKKPKISVKSNLILKGPDQDRNMFHSQQKMAFRRLEDNERYGLAGPVTFNNLITTQFMQLQPQAALDATAGDMMSYSQEARIPGTATTPVDTEITNDSQIFSFNQQMNVNPMSMHPPPQKTLTNDPSYIKLEATIKQNTQSPSLERMCNANLLNNSAINREYKASPPLEDIHKNMNEIKNEVKSDAFYNLGMNNTATNPPIIDQYLIDNIMGEQYSGHVDLSTVVVDGPDQQNYVIEIDDNSDDNKLLPRFDMNNLPLESLYLMHNDFHFLDNDIAPNNIPNDTVNEMNRIVSELTMINQKENMDTPNDIPSGEFPNFIQGKKDPMMNTPMRQTTNKINVKNIELMKN